MDRAKQEQLVVRWQTVGDQDAANELCEFLRSRLYAVANWYLGRTSGQSVDDFISDTLQVFVRNVESGRFKPDGTASPLTYAASILRKKMHARLRRRRPDSYDPAVLANIIDPASLDHCQRSKIDAMIECFDRLPEQLRKTFSLCLGLDVLDGRVVEFEQCNQREVAEVLGMSTSWVSKECIRAARWTQECVESKFDEPESK